MLTIPRAGSCRAGDREYDPYLVRIIRRLEVRFNGHVIDDVVAYDCNHGLILTQTRRNRHVLEHERTLRGDVTVAWR
jgi:hypothetical protein